MSIPISEFNQQNRYLIKSIQRDMAIVQNCADDQYNPSKKTIKQLAFKNGRLYELNRKKCGVWALPSYIIQSTKMGLGNLIPGLTKGCCMGLGLVCTREDIIEDARNNLAERIRRLDTLCKMAGAAFPLSKQVAQAVLLNIRGAESGLQSKSKQEMDNAEELNSVKQRIQNGSQRIKEIQEKQVKMVKKLTKKISANKKKTRDRLKDCERKIGDLDLRVSILEQQNAPEAALCHRRPE